MAERRCTPLGRVLMYLQHALHSCQGRNAGKSLYLSLYLYLNNEVKFGKLTLTSYCILLDCNPLL
jgi:hypothetical protein